MEECELINGGKGVQNAHALPPKTTHGNYVAGVGEGTRLDINGGPGLVQILPVWSPTEFEHST